MAETHATIPSVPNQPIHSGITSLSLLNCDLKKLLIDGWKVGSFRAAHPRSGRPGI